MAIFGVHNSLVIFILPFNLRLFQIKMSVYCYMLTNICIVCQPLNIVVGAFNSELFGEGSSRDDAPSTNCHDPATIVLGKEGEKGL